MPTEVTVDQAGRILIPKNVRDRLHLRPGDTLKLELEGDAIKLNLDSGGQLIKENGMWVLSSEPLGEVDIVSESLGQTTGCHGDKGNAVGEPPSLVGSASIELETFCIEGLGDFDDFNEGVLL